MAATSKLVSLLFKRLNKVIWLLIITAFCMVLAISLRFYNLADLDKWLVWLLIIIFFFPLLAFTANSLYQYYTLSYKVESNFLLFLQLMLFYSGLFIAIEYLRPKPPTLFVPHIDGGTVGFKAWQARIEISQIQIWYQDSNMRWKQVDEQIINNHKNWLFPVKPYNNPGFTITDTSIIAEDCYLIFNPTDKHLQHFNNVRLDARIKFLQIDGPNAGISFVTNADTAKYTPGVFIGERIVCKNIFLDQLCIEFSFPYFDEPHLWLPAFDREPALLSQNTREDILRVPTRSKKQLRKDGIILSAQVFNNQLMFSARLPDYGGSSILFESKMEEDVK